MRIPLALACCCAAACSPGDGDAPTGTDSSGTEDGPLSPEEVATDHSLGGLRIEIDHVEGRPLDPEVLDLLSAELERLRTGGQLVKPSGISIVTDETLPATGVAVHTFEALSALVREHAGPLRDGQDAVLHALYVDGGYEDDNEETTTLGFAWGGSWIVMFPDNIEAGCARELSSVRPGDQDTACVVAETAVWMHELGHLFGLVNLGAPLTSAHEDPGHPHHDLSSDCLMYWLLGSSGAIGEIGRRFGRGDPEVPRLDAACEADLLALQAGSAR